MVAGTLVHTDKGLVPIEQLCAGDRVLSRHDESKENVWRKVLNTEVWEGGTIQVVKFSSDDGSGQLHHVYLVDDHRLKAVDEGWTETSELRWGSFIELHNGTQGDVFLRWPI